MSVTTRCNKRSARLGRSVPVVYLLAAIQPCLLYHWVKSPMALQGPSAGAPHPNPHIRYQVSTPCLSDARPRGVDTWGTAIVAEACDIPNAWNSEL